MSEPGEALKEQVLVVVSIPTAAVQGTTETITTTMTSQFDLVTIDPVVDEIRLVDAGVDPMVTKSVESYCRKNGIVRVTTPVLEEIRAKMPTPKVFGKPRT